MAQASIIGVKAKITDELDLQRILCNILSGLPKNGPILFDTACYAVKRLKRTHDIQLSKETIMKQCLISFQRIGKKLPKYDDKLTVAQLIEKYRI